MLWEELTTKRFESAVKECGGVCVLPIGVVEKHSDHLPLGTDMLTARAICGAAAEKEQAVVFPYYFFGQIAEARHYPGTLSLDNRRLLENLEAVCGEISRNGLKKILIISSHGGNDYFLPFFAQGMPGKNRDYAVYVGSLNNGRREQYENICEKAGTDDLGQHAGVSETALIMRIRPDLVRMDEADPRQSKPLNRLDAVKKHSLITGFNWYADYPNHFAGDPSKATPELGAYIFDMLVDNIAGCIRAVKNDSVSEGLFKEFYARAEKPDAGISTVL